MTKDPVTVGDVGDDIQKYIKQLEEDQKEMDALSQMLAKLKAELMAMAGDPGVVLNFFFNHFMPGVMERSEGILSIGADQLNTMSGFRNLIAGVQNDFNKFGTGKAGPDDQKNYETMIKQIDEALKALGEDTGFDDSTTAQMKSSFKDMLKLLKDAGSGAELRKWWDESKKPGGSKYSDDLKQFADDGNTLNQSVSTIGQAAQTQIQYDTNFYQQLMGFQNQGLQNWHKGVETSIGNQKTN